MYIDRDEVLRYLGYKRGIIYDEIWSLINKSIEEIKNYINYRYTYKIFDIKIDNSEVKIIGSTLVFKGRDIAEHLKDSKMCAVLAVTLGSEIETKIKYYEKVNLTKALILDACASTAIEWICEEVQSLIKEEAKIYGLGITYRYSPGYGDFPIDIQSKILNVLETQKNIGLTVTEENILIPRKSITAIIGFQDKNIVSNHPGCRKCNNSRRCEFKRGGSYCGN